MPVAMQCVISSLEAFSTLNAFLINAHSFATTDRSSAAVRQLRTLRMKSRSLTDMIFSSLSCAVTVSHGFKTTLFQIKKPKQRPKRKTNANAKEDTQTF